MSQNNRQSDRQSAQPQGPRILVENGQVLEGRITSITLSPKDKSRREGVVIKFAGGETAFMHATQIGSHFPESRLCAFRVGDSVKVEVRVEGKGGKRSVKASEKFLFFDDVVRQLESGTPEVSGECVNVTDVGAFIKITTPGPAYNFIGLLHFNSIPGGRGALKSVKVGQKMVVDISKARVDREKGMLKISLNGFGAQRREIASRFPAGIQVTANVAKESGDSFLLRLKSGELCLLAKSELDPRELKSFKPGASTRAFVTGVDGHGLILLSKVMPE